MRMVIPPINNLYKSISTEKENYTEKKKLFTETNKMRLLTSGILGFPGIALLYWIEAKKIL